jgi:lia operon protein LiaG
MFMLASALIVAAAMPFSRAPQQSDRVSLDGNRVAVYNVAGSVTVERGTGSAVIVEVLRGGADARQLRVEQRTIDGRTALCVVYPNERIIYRGRGGRFTTTNSVNRNDCRTAGGGGFLGVGRRIQVSDRGDGVEAWADLRILVPAGRDVEIKHMVGDVVVAGVDATLFVDVGSSRVTTRDTRGALNLDGGSGDMTVNGHTGDLSVDVGSGSVRIDRVDGATISVEAGSGEIRGTDLRADELLLDTGSGSIDITAVSARRLRMDTGSGSTRAALVSNPADVNIDTGSGSVTLTLPANFGARVDISTGSGGIDSDFEVRDGRIRRSEMSGTIGDGRGTVTIDTGSGGVSLRRNSAASGRDR